MKTCIVCHMDKPTTAFHSDVTREDGFDPRCSSCKNEQARERYAAKIANRPPRPAPLGQSVYNRRWRERNPGKARAATKRWEKANPERKKHYDSLRYARKRGAPVSDFTDAQWEALKAAFAYRCAYCNERPEKLTRDHVIPLSRGGSHTASNIVPACQPCNSRKNAGDAPDFQRVLMLVGHGDSDFR